MSACAGAVGGLRGPVRQPLLQPGPAARVSRVPDRAAGAAGAEQDDHLPGRGRTGGRCRDAGGGQRLQFFLSESPWEAELISDRRLELLREQPATAPHDDGVIVIDDSGDRRTARRPRTWAGSG
nr:transposase [Streptomyces griseofuscus]